MNKKLWQRQMSLGEILSEGFRLIRINIIPILLLVICLQVPLNFFRTILFSVITVEKYGETTVTAIATGISWIDISISLIVLTGIAYVVENSLQGRSTSLGTILKFSFSRFGDVFQTSLFLFIITLGLTLLLIVPGIIWSTYYSFAVIIAALREMKTKLALEYSKKLIQGQWWRVFGIYIAIGLASVIINLPILILSRKVPDIKFLYIFTPLTIGNIVAAITLVMVVVLFLNTEFVRDFQRQNRGKTNRT
jgi:hypothetical protein